ncbi:hypothetical protein KQI84_08850 [bacterium]|nr:hypothetical protein [bacterium]
MSKGRIISALVALVVLGLAIAVAQSGGRYDLLRSGQGGGGGVNSTGGHYSVSGLAGQAGAGGALTGTSTEVRGGFWIPVVPTPTPTPSAYDGWTVR